MSGYVFEGATCVFFWSLLSIVLSKPTKMDATIPFWDSGSTPMDLRNPNSKAIAAINQPNPPNMTGEISKKTQYLTMAPHRIYPKYEYGDIWCQSDWWFQSPFKLVSYCGIIIIIIPNIIEHKTYWKPLTKTLNSTHPQYEHRIYLDNHLYHHLSPIYFEYTPPSCSHD